MWAVGMGGMQGMAGKDYDSRGQEPMDHLMEKFSLAGGGHSVCPGDYMAGNETLRLSCGYPAYPFVGRSIAQLRDAV